MRVWHCSTLNFLVIPDPDPGSRREWLSVLLERRFCPRQDSRESLIETPPAPGSRIGVRDDERGRIARLPKYRKGKAMKAATIVSLPPTGPQPAEHVLVGVSGGMDSIVLLHALHALGYPLQAAHVNYGLRGQDSDGDEALVRTVCEQWGIPLEVLNAGEPAPVGASVQDWARQLRYSFFEDVAQHAGIAYVAVAHHQDDQAETLLLRLIRGSGVEGLAAMPASRPIRQGSPIQLIRPFLNTPRSALKAYAEANSLAWRTDGSNADLRYATNPAPPLGEWTTGLVDDDGSVGPQPSIQVDEFGTLTVSYYDASNESLKLARRPLGEAWDVGLLTAGTGLATEGQVGLFSALFAEDSANLHVAYYEGLSDDLYYAYRATCEF